MPREQTNLQKKAIEAIIANVEEFLGFRYPQVIRMNPDIASIWDDLKWQMMNRLRFSLSNEKAFGGVRIHVGELLMSDDTSKIRELFGTKSQNSLQGELVEEKEDDAHRTHGTMEIHDMRTLYRAIKPGLDKNVALIQTFIWWDLEDAADIARINHKKGIVQALAAKGITDDIAEYYQGIMQKDSKPSTEQIVAYEIGKMKQTLECYRARRSEDAAYKMIIRRERAKSEKPEALIEAIASQQNVLKTLKKDEELPESMWEQFAKALQVPRQEVTKESARKWLEATIEANHKRLRDSMMGTGSGKAVNVKLEKQEQLEQLLAQLENEHTASSEA